MPPGGAPTVTVAGSVSTDESMTLTVSTQNLLTISTAVVDFTGTISRSGAGATSYSVSGRLAAPVTVATGLVLKTASLAYDGTTFFGAGALEITANGGSTTIDSAFAFRDPKNWTASLSVAGPRT